jgi:hypothetical protein
MRLESPKAEELRCVGNTPSLQNRSFAKVQSRSKFLFLKRPSVSYLACSILFRNAPASELAHRGADHHFL